MAGGGGDHTSHGEAEEQQSEECSSPSRQCRNIPSLTGLLGMISSSTCDNGTNLPTSQQNFLSTSPAGPPVAGDMDHFLTLPEILLELDLPSGGRSGRRNLLQDFGGDDSTNGLELPERLGFESSIERMSGEDRTLESIWKTVGPNSRSLDRRRSRMMSDATDRDFPPLLYMMDGFGRPKYVLEKEKSDGRLVITMKRNERRRGVVRAWRSGNEEQMITRMVVLDD